MYITYSISTFFPWVLLWKFLQPSSSSIFKTHLLLLKAKQKNNHTWLFFCSAFKGFPNCWEFMTSNAVIYLVSFLVIKIPIVCLYVDISNIYAVSAVIFYMNGHEYETKKVIYFSHFPSRILWIVVPLPLFQTWIKNFYSCIIWVVCVSFMRRTFMICVFRNKVLGKHLNIKAS